MLARICCFSPPNLGNFDPVNILLEGTPEIVYEAAAKCIQKGKGRLILSPGCEVPVNTPVENVAAFCSSRAFKNFEGSKKK